MDDIELKIVNNLVAVILCYLNNGVAIGELLNQPKAYGARLIWPQTSNPLSPVTVDCVFRNPQKTQDASTRSLIFTYWEYGNFKHAIKGNSIKEILPDNLKPVVDCICGFGVDLEGQVL